MSRPTPHERAVAAAARRGPTANAVLGDGSLLLTFSQRGELEQLMWPHVDHDPQLGELRLGVLDRGAVRWLDTADDAEHEQAYDGDADVLRTVVRAPDLGEVTVTDVVAVDGPVLVRHVTGAAAPVVVYLRPMLGGTHRAGGLYLDPATGALVAHRRDRVLAVGLDVPATATMAEIARDPDSVDGVERGKLRGGGIVHGEVDGALRADAVHEAVTITIAIASTHHEALARLQQVRQRGADAVVAQRREHDAALLATTAEPLGDGADARLYRRSLLAFGAVSDRATGGVIAAPEADPDFVRSGGYGFVWPRDLAFILLAHVAAGRRDLAEPALRWLVTAQPASGIWDQRSWTDGSLGPSWGAQLDETGAVLVAMRSAVEAFDDAELEAELWPAVRRAADALVAATDPITGLPAPSMDLWEERTGLHAYTAAASCGGLRAAAELAQRRGEVDLAAWWRATADRTAAGIDVHLWSSEHGRFVRSIAVARGDATGEPTPSAYGLLDVPASPVPSVDALDATVDVSLLGLTYPFGVVPAGDPRMQATIAAVRERLTAADGGLLRWDGDPYLDGNPWVLATLWLGLVERPPGVALPADGVAYARQVATSTDLLAEQIDAATGQPAWILPLTWSHAMYVLALRPDPPALPTRHLHAAEAETGR